MKYRPKHMAEYIALRIVMCVLGVLPHRAALFVGWLLALLAYHVVGFRVAAARSRIREVFGDELPESEVRRIAWVSLRNMIFNAVEMARAPRITAEWYASICDCRSAVDDSMAVARDRGAVAALPHMGNWEMAGLGCFLLGAPVFSIVAAQKNPLVNRLLNRLRSGPGITTIERGSGTMREVVRQLKSGGVLAILPDVRVREQGVAIPFLGRTANLGKGMAMFARHVNVPILPAVATRKGWARHSIRVFDPVCPDPDADKTEDIVRITREVMQIIERAIREQPEQWFWYNKRWVLEPRDAE